MRSSTPNLQNWLALLHCMGIGPITFQKYLQHDPTLNSIPAHLQPNWQAVERDLKWLSTEPGAQIITFIDPQYPAALKNIPDPPPILYVLGDAQFLNKPQLAMVGSRNCTVHGKHQAQKFATEFANLGLVITSGLAIGIDAASHIGALDCAQGSTIAVLAHGMDTIYPPRHRNLFARIKERGCLVSEFPIGVIPLPEYFPRRNRVISGLSLGVLVIEAALNSGSLITARYAVEQGREVFAMPGAISSAKSRGCHQLIKQGAKLVESLDDVLQELVALLNQSIRDKYADTAVKLPAKAHLSAQQQQFLEFIDYDTTCVDQIIERTGLASSAVGALLLELELHGVVTAVPGGYARRSD